MGLDVFEMWLQFARDHDDRVPFWLVRGSASAPDGGFGASDVVNSECYAFDALANESE